MQNKPDTLFSTLEASLILALLNTETDESVLVTFRNVARQIQWNGLQQIPPVFPFIYPYLKPITPHIDVPDTFREKAQQSYKQTRIANQYRLSILRKLYKEINAQGLTLVLTGGGAELVDFPDEPYLSQRTITEIQFICPKKDLRAVDELLRSHDFVFHNIGPKNLSEQKSRAYSLQELGHYEYNSGQVSHVKLYLDIVSGDNHENLPPDFTAKILRNTRQGQIKGIPVTMAQPAHLLIQLICAEANLHQNRALLSRVKKEQTATASERTAQLRADLDARQLNYLIQLSAFLKRYNDKLDMQEVGQTLARVSRNPLLAHYLNLAVLHIPGFNPLAYPAPDPKTLCRERERFMQREVFKQDFQQNRKKLMAYLKVKYRHFSIRILNKRFPD